MRDDNRRNLLMARVREATGYRAATVRPWRSGVDFWADLLVDAGTVVGVLRSPRNEVVETSYDGVVDFGAIIEREAEALGLMAAVGLPVPEVLAWHRCSGPGDTSWMLQRRIDHDDSGLVPRGDLGRLTRRLHAIRPDTTMLGPMPHWASFVSSRLQRRLAAAARYCPDLDPCSVASLADIATTRQPYAHSLLHMDLRESNVCVRAGRIEAIIDAANCLVGDPLFELARIRAYGLLDDDFLTGYGAVDANDPDIARLLDIYELDTAALLTVVAVEEADDRGLFEQQRGRIQELVTVLRSE